MGRDVTAAGSAGLVHHRRVNGLNLLVLRVADLAAARRFYECFGMEFVREQHGRGPVHLSSSGAGGVFELYPGAPDRTGLGFAVPDLAATAARFHAAGFTPGEPATAAFVVRDPDGRRVEVSQA